MGVWKLVVISLFVCCNGWLFNFDEFYYVFFSLFCMRGNFIINRSFYEGILIVFLCIYIWYIVVSKCVVIYCGYDVFFGFFWVVCDVWLYDLRMLIFKEIKCYY